MEKVDRNLVQVKLYGNPCYYYDDAFDEKAMKNDDGKIKFYTLDKLPGNILIVRFICECMESTLQFIIGSDKKLDVKQLIFAMANKKKYCLKLQSGSNQETSISTQNGFITFKQYNTDNVEAQTNAYITLPLPNSYCINQFQKLIDY